MATPKPTWFVVHFLGYERSFWLVSQAHLKEIAQDGEHWDNAIAGDERPIWYKVKGKPTRFHGRCLFRGNHKEAKSYNDALTTLKKSPTAVLEKALAAKNPTAPSTRGLCRRAPPSAKVDSRGIKVLNVGWTANKWHDLLEDPDFFAFMERIGDYDFLPLEDFIDAYTITKPKPKEESLEHIRRVLSNYIIEAGFGRQLVEEEDEEMPELEPQQ